MPAPRTDIDVQGVATRIALRGIRGTARDTGLPVATVRDIAKREGVKVPDASTRLVPASTQDRVQQRPAYREGDPLSTQPAHSIATDEVSANGARGRLSASRIGATALETIEQGMGAEPEKSLLLLDSALTAGKLLQTGNVPGWERQREQVGTQVVNIALLGVPPEQCVLEIPSIATLPGTVEDCPSGDQA
jgi:hypothetical protein